jgi:hypothetical protein
MLQKARNVIASVHTSVVSLSITEHRILAIVCAGVGILCGLLYPTLTPTSTFEPVGQNRPD